MLLLPLMDNSFKTLIDSAQEVLILLPQKPNLDQVASGLSLYLSFLGSGKDVTISCPVAMTAEFSRLIGVDKITGNLGDKNLIIKFVNYNATDVDKVSYDIENSQFKLTISPKVGFKSPTKDQIEVSYAGGSSDFVVLVGGTSESDFPVLQTLDFASSTIIHLGTGLLEIENKDLQVLSFAQSASSISEIVAGLIKEGGFVLDPDIATNLIVGIESESKNFQSSEVTVNTFETFTELLKLGGLRFKKVPTSTFPQGSIPNKPYNQVNQLPINPVIQDRQMTPEEAEEEIQQDIPPSWSEPKIFTGTSVS